MWKGFESSMTDCRNGNNIKLLHFQDYFEKIKKLQRKFVTKFGAIR